MYTHKSQAPFITIPKKWHTDKTFTNRNPFSSSQDFTYPSWKDTIVLIDKIWQNPVGATWQEFVERWDKESWISKSSSMIIPIIHQHLREAPEALLIRIREVLFLKTKSWGRWRQVHSIKNIEREQLPAGFTLEKRLNCYCSACSYLVYGFSPPTKKYKSHHSAGKNMDSNKNITIF